MVACYVALSQIEQNKVVFNCLPCSAEIMTLLCVCADASLSIPLILSPFFLSLFLSVCHFIYFLHS